MRNSSRFLGPDPCGRRVLSYGVGNGMEIYQSTRKCTDGAAGRMVLEKTAGETVAETGMTVGIQHGAIECKNAVQRIRIGDE